jgi:hypothetical protein
MSGNSEENFTRGELKPSIHSEEVRSSGLLCIPEKAKVIRVEADIESKFPARVRFSPNVEISNFFMMLNPREGNILADYEGGKTIILMAYKENPEKIWVLIQFDFGKINNDVLSSKIGWIELNSLNLGVLQATSIQKLMKN